MELKYEDLVKDHWERLYSKLRLFSASAGPEFLDTWVPDENHNRGIFGIFEAAANANIAVLSVVVKQETSKSLDEAWLKEKLSVLGNIVFTKRGEDLVITLNFSDVKSELKSLFEQKANTQKETKKKIPSPKKDGVPQIPFVHDVHRAGIEMVLRNIRHENKALQADAEQVLLEQTQSDVTLSVLVDKQGMVASAAHRGAYEPAHRAILDELCDVLQGRPLQEGRDHGIIRVEHALRDPTIQWPLPGLTCSENTSLAFKLPQDLIRRIFKAYVDRFNIKVEWNFWDDPPTNDWRKLVKEEKITRAQEILKKAAQGMGVDPSIVEVVEILGYGRVVIGYNPSTVKLDFASKMIKMERILKESLDPRIDLNLENLEDKNKRDSRTGRFTEKISKTPPPAC